LKGKESQISSATMVKTHKSIFKNSKLEIRLEFLKTAFLDFYLHSPADFRFFPLQFVDSSFYKLVTLLKFLSKVFIPIDTLAGYDSGYNWV
jgi:hypothetical protein